MYTIKNNWETVKSAAGDYQRRLVMIPTSQIDHVNFNPHGRTEKSQIEQLLADIRNDGDHIAMPILVVAMGTGRYVACDGNRRLACARELGILELKAYECEPVQNGLTKKDLIDHLYITTNRGTKAHTPSAKLCAHLLGGPVYDKNVVRHARYLRSICTPSEVATLAKDSITPMIINLARTTAFTCLPGVSEDSQIFKDFYRKSLFWMRAQGTQQETKEFLAYMKKVRKDDLFITLREAIDNDRDHIPGFRGGTKSTITARARKAAATEARKAYNREYMKARNEAKKAAKDLAKGGKK